MSFGSPYLLFLDPLQVHSCYYVRSELEYSSQGLWTGGPSGLYTTIPCHGRLVKGPGSIRVTKEILEKEGPGIGPI